MDHVSPVPSIFVALSVAVCWPVGEMLSNPAAPSSCFVVNNRVFNLHKFPRRLLIMQVP